MAIATGILFEDPQIKPLSNAGQFQSGCYALFFLTGGTTPANVYADGNLSVPLTQVPGSAQPSCTADGTGLFNAIYLDPAVIYHVQMFTANGVKFRDVDPYVVQPIPASIAALIALVNGFQSQINAINAEIAALQASYPWANITGVPGPLVTLGASVPSGSGSTFWCDNGTWATPNQNGTSITQSNPAAIPTIGAALTTVINAIPVTAGHTYAMLFEGDIFATGSTGPLTVQLTPDAGALTGVGQGLGWVEFFGGQTFQSIHGNAASPGVQHSIYSGDDNYIRLYGRFIVPVGCTSVSLQMATGSGSITAQAGCYVTLTQIA